MQAGIGARRLIELRIRISRLSSLIRCSEERENLFHAHSDLRRDRIST